VAEEVALLLLPALSEPSSIDVPNQMGLGDVAGAAPEAHGFRIRPLPHRQQRLRLPSVAFIQT